ncbi:MAG: T9SS type A sorting domain-containing protein [Gammaproteobacteria bacterium]|nr:T9SS type A sorting domain-containing protein [Gammaproteobacteria bacterium]
MSRKLVLVALGLVTCGSSAFAITFTGDVPTDFLINSAILFDDPNDVGLPASAPPGVISGWELADVQFLRDRPNNAMHIGLNFTGIGGDADGDGLEGGTSWWLANLMGYDEPMLGGSEAICIALDIEYDGVPDGVLDIVAGDAIAVAPGLFQVCQFDPNYDQYTPALAFNGLLPQHTGSFFYGPDYELTITNFDQLIDPSLYSYCFDIAVFAGSYQDDGVGEDYIIDRVCFDEEPPVSAAEPTQMDLLAAWPNPFNPVTTLVLDLAATGPARVDVFDLQGRRVAVVHDGILSAGRHEISFDAGSLSSGLYLARLQTDSGGSTVRLVLAK